jgi:hypothetical protein
MEEAPMKTEDLIGPAATLTAALLRPIEPPGRPDPQQESRAAVHAADLFMKVLGSLAAKFPEPPST